MFGAVSSPSVLQLSTVFCAVACVAKTKVCSSYCTEQSERVCCMLRAIREHCEEGLDVDLEPAQSLKMDSTTYADLVASQLQEERYVAHLEECSRV